MSKATDWKEVLIGAAIIGVSLADIVPGDELIAVPTGAYLMLDGFGVL